MNCPKCGHAQSPGEECVQCGIVFGKFYAIEERKRERSRKENNPAEPADAETDDLSLNESRPSGFLQAYFWVPYHTPWKPIPKYLVISLLLLFVYVMFLLAGEPFYQLYPDTNMMDSMIASMLRRVDLVFHEAGHWLFGIFGSRTLAILGGSLNQVLIPLIVTVSFWYRRDASGFAFGLIWMFINFLEVGIYMADARHPVLPLIGNLDPFQGHDWINLFNRWDLWTVDIALAKTTWVSGWIGMVATSLWYAWTGFTHLAKKNEFENIEF